MRILLVAATAFEIDPFLKMNTNTEALITGVGMPATIHHLTKNFMEHRYDLVIQAGIAGAFTGQIERGEVVFVKEDVFADLGVEEKDTFKTLFHLGFAAEDEFPFSRGWLVNPHQLSQISHLKAVRGITVNKLSDRHQQTLQLQKTFMADIESMEGAAFHYTCLLMNMPFIQLRSISNGVGERDKDKWKIKEAVENLNLELIKLTETLT